MKNTFYLLIWLLLSSPMAFSSGGGSKSESGGDGNYKEINPPIVVNLPDARQLRLLQVSIAVSSSNAAVLHAMDVHNPLIRNNLIMLFASQNKDTIKTKEGREKLRADAEEVVNKALKEVGMPPIDSLYFTGLVIQ